jgi:hypothetical protein
VEVLKAALPFRERRRPIGAVGNLNVIQGQNRLSSKLSARLHNRDCWRMANDAA